MALAEGELGKAYRKDAAELLRAAEHFSFAALAIADAKASKVSPELEDGIREEVKYLTHKANEHWGEGEESEHHSPVTAIFRNSLSAAQKALKAGAYRQALEVARGAEALAHVKKHLPERLQDRTEHPTLPRP